MQAINAKRIFCSLAILVLALSGSACGFRKEPDPVLNEAESRTEDANAGQEPESQLAAETIAAADFYYVQLPDNNMLGNHAFNEDYLYYTQVVSTDTGDPPYAPETHVMRLRISDGYVEENYIAGRKNRWEAWDQVLLADSSGNCYLFWGPAQIDETEDSLYSLEKYGANGELLWHADYAPEELQDMGTRLEQGIVTESGRVFLHTVGTQASVFVFSEDGALENIFIPGLESLDGIASGKDGAVYAYCITEERTLFQKVGGDGQIYVCPIAALQVYSGSENGIFLRTGEGMWNYVPETEHTELLWGWEDEYVQINGIYVEELFSGAGGCLLLCREQNEPALRYDFPHTRPTFTFAMISFPDSRDYPGKQTVTLGAGFEHAWLDKMAKLYNRHSKEYRVELVIEEDSSLLEMQLLQGKGADLINIADLYPENLARLGAFEDLGAYYDTSGAADREDILDSVRNACMISGREVAVIPAFAVLTMQEKEAWFTPEEWDVWNFLEMARENRVFKYQNPSGILDYCMGIRYGERYIDRETGQCHFDCEEFRLVLESCKNCKTFQPGSIESYSDKSFGDENGEDGWLFLTTVEVKSAWDVISEPDIFSDGDPEYSAKLIGYPGWNGGEYRLRDYGMLAINSASENKEGAWDFLEYLLSDEFQNMVDWAFPSRKDSFEVRLNDLYDNMSDWLYIDQDTGEPVNYQPTEENLSHIRDMVDSAIHDTRGANKNHWHIVSEEAQMYFAGDATLEDTVNKIQNRVQLYLNEQSD